MNISYSETKDTSECIVRIDILINCQNSQIDYLAYGVRTIMEGKCKWNPLA